jgi:hypothetical protein
MSRYLPSFRGWIALILALFASVFLPNTFPARGPSGFLGQVSTQAWITAAVTVAVCLGASVFAVVRGGMADRVAAVIAALFTLVLIVMFATTPTPKKSLQPTPVGAGSSAFAFHVIGPAWLSSWVVRHHYASQ